MTQSKGQTRVYCLYGQPVSHSYSPRIFNYTFEKLGMNRAYFPFEVSPEMLGRAVEAACTLGFDGFNVTMPHKAAILKLLNKLDKTAERAQAVNTVASTPHGLVGHNTDGEGAYRAIRTQGFDPKRKTVTVIGAGGAASAIVQRLSTEVKEATVLDRKGAKAKLLAERTTGSARVRYGKLTKKSLEDSVQTSELLINGTPLQTPEILKSIGLTRRVLPTRLWIFDLAYNHHSRLSPSGRTINPLEMLLQQAALSYEIWLGKKAPIGLMRTALTKGWRLE